MINIDELLYEIFEDENVFNPDYDLIESNLLDSYNFIELISRLEDEGIIIHPTRINKELLRTPKGIKKIIQDTMDNKEM